MTNKLLVICGPTATGKTGIAIEVAQQFSGEIISADSRQIYKDFDIGTGKEVAELKAGRAVKQAEQWIVDGAPVHGYDLVDGHTQYSAGAFAEIARSIIKQLWQQDKLPIVVGGTGLYIRGIVDGFGSAGAARDDELRRELESLSVDMLQKRLSNLTPKRLADMNQSDRHNPRRLIRAIEIASQSTPQSNNKIDADVLMIGLTGSEKTVSHRVAQRIQEMLRLGLAEEVARLKQAGFTAADPAMQAIGYHEFTGDVSIDAIEQAIILHTMQYVKRQVTWFKKDPRIMWVSIDDPEWHARVMSLVTEWYNGENVPA